MTFPTVLSGVLAIRFLFPFLFPLQINDVFHYGFTSEDEGNIRVLWFGMVT